MKEKYLPVFYSSFGTEEEQQEQIKKFFGNAKLKEVNLLDNEISKLSKKIEEKLPTAKYDYGMGGFMYSVLSSERKNALTELISIIKSNNLENKFTIKNNAIVSKDLIYAEKPLWMGLSQNKYEQKLEENEFTK